MMEERFPKSSLRTAKFSSPGEVGEQASMMRLVAVVVDGRCDEQGKSDEKDRPEV